MPEPVGYLPSRGHIDLSLHIWLLERISRHPDVLACTEAAVRGDDDYLDAVIKEAMRLRPVAPMTARLAAKDFELPG